MNGTALKSVFPLKPVLLDVFSGAGGCAAGYERAGFSCVGIDVEPQPNYIGDQFIQADALRILEMVAEGYEEWDNIIAIHASPPCQGYTTMNNRHGSDVPKLIEATRELLDATGLPYVIENVAGARSEMKMPIRLVGEMFGLAVHRPRLFEANWPLMGIPSPPRQKDPVAVYGKNDQRRLWTRKDGTELRAATLLEAQDAMGIGWMGWDEIREAVPPAYTEFIGHQLAGWLLTAPGRELAEAAA